MENMELKKAFKDIQCKYKNIENAKKEVMRKIVDFKDSPSHSTINDMYVSPEVGLVSDKTVGVYTSTVFTEDVDSNNEVLPFDVVMLRVTGVDGNEVHAPLSKSDCIELIRHLATAVSLLRD